MVTVKEKKAVEHVELPAVEIESNFGTDSFELVEPTEPIEKRKRTPRQSKKSESERAIEEVKALIALKLSVQRGRKDVANYGGTGDIYGGTGDIHPLNSIKGLG